MNKWVLGAGILSGITFFIHVIFGGWDVHTPLLESEIPLGLKAIVTIIWHTVSALILINTIALFISASRRKYSGPLISIVSAQYIALAILFIFYGLLRLGTVWLMPQWIVFILIPALAYLGIKNANLSEQT
ncbi:MAG: hypothetical protein V3V02_07715 [Rhizobiaceae bacterium]